MSTTRTIEPTVITQGEQLVWEKSLDDYPASDYTLTYRFRGLLGPGFNVTATADDDRHEITVSAAVTETLGLGRYDWQAWVVDNSDATKVYMIGEGRVTVKQGFSQADSGPVDMRTAAQICLDSIDAALLAFATSDIQEYEVTTPVGSHRVKRGDKANLMSMRKEYAIRVSLERTKQRVDSGGPLVRSVGIVVREC